MTPSTLPAITPGFLAFHGNRAEDLVEVVVHWLHRHPLAPLEEDIILVQSNGMAEWVKMELARLGGVCAAARVELPSRFLWRTYRQVLGSDAVPAQSPMDKLPMVWRLMQLLPVLSREPVFAPVAGFLMAGEPDRMLQLATRLADLFDQYQNYRPDWLEAWAQGHDHLLPGAGAAVPLPPEQLWQPTLWRALLAALDPPQRDGIRPALHQRVVAQLSSAIPPVARVARRVLVFGMSQMPGSTLEALVALAPHSQVLLAIPNPCRFHWGDIMDGRELLTSQRRRQPARDGRDLSAIPLHAMHAHAHPLLSAWGRQGRDFIRQLDAFDDAQLSRQHFGLDRIDLFDDSPDVPGTPLLRQVQNRIRDLTPLAEHPALLAAAPLPEQDASIVFHIAHSPVRELEILHDQLLALLAAPPTDGQPALNPRDVVVMVPDVSPMAPVIQAVFGQYKRQDARYIPFDIADLGASATSPLLTALGWVLQLPQQRCLMSELVDLLEVAAVAARFGIDQDTLPQLRRWMVGAGIRWGLNDAHRTDLGLSACGEQNSAWFGLRRMLLGYATGAISPLAAAADMMGITPYTDIGGLEAELAGSLAHLLQTLTHWVEAAAIPARPETWAERCRSLLAALIKAETLEDKQALRALEDGLAAWQLACEQASFSGVLPLQVLRTAWLEAVDLPGLNARFRAGGVTFCTLMPMRAIPFAVVCLLGMNDGDYPRRGSRSDFDMMGLAGMGRPGDRSRRDDDRQLMLEALLSARRVLYISWCGRSVRDNSPQPPSVLVSQLRDYLSAGWCPELVARCTTQHPLQPFSRRYFEAGTPLLTHALEWRAAHGSASVPEPAQLAELAPFAPDPRAPLALAQLAQFLGNPVKAFFRQRLRVVFEHEVAEDTDHESFEITGLRAYTLVQDLLAGALVQPGGDAGKSAVMAGLLRLRQAGELPMAGFGDIEQQALQDLLLTLLQAWQTEQARFPLTAARQSLRFQAGQVLLEDWLDPLRQATGPTDEAERVRLPECAWLVLEPGRLLEDSPRAAARVDKLLLAWVRSLASAACGVSAQGVLVGRDGVLDIAPMPPAEASAMLTTLLALWQDGMNAPLPLPPRTALAWLAGKDALAQYEGTPMQRGEREEPCMARVFPDFAALSADGRFEALARSIHAPLLAWAGQYVRARHHAEAGLAVGARP
jgi:exodeoxyribonuclease V gamma subunit